MLASNDLHGWDILSIQPNVTLFLSSNPDLEAISTGRERF